MGTGLSHGRHGSTSARSGTDGLIGREDPLDFLRPPTGKCLGAVFLAYAFDERFFESLLATLLPIHADPETDPTRFLDEGRRRLREIPIMVLLDAHHFGGGHRLPFGIALADREIAFQPKISLALFEDHARLVVGSGNLNEGGYGGNAEFAARLKLSYQADASLLAEIKTFIGQVGARGEEWDRFQEQLGLLLGRSKRKATLPWVLHAGPSDQAVLEQFLARIPKNAKLQAVGVLAAVQPEDDAAQDTDVFERVALWAEQRRAGDVPFDIGLPWEGNAVAPPADPGTADLSELIGRLCARIEGVAGEGTIGWLIPGSVDGDQVVCRGGGNRLFRLPKNTLQEEMAAVPARLWAVEEVVGTGPVEALSAIAERANVQWWLFPELRVASGEVFRRPLHGKLVVVTTTEGAHKRTHLLVGAPNFHRFGSRPRAVVEAALYTVHNRHLRLSDLSDELVPSPADQFFLESHACLAPKLSPPPFLENAVYNASHRTLTLEWKADFRAVKAVYQRGDSEEELVEGVPGIQSVVHDFELDRQCAELRVLSGEDSWVVPVRVSEIHRLVAEEPEGFMGFWDLVDLHAGRSQRVAANNPETLLADDDTSGMERYSAQDVFAALLAVANGVVNAGPSLGAFAVAMDGPIGVRKIAERFFDARRDPNLWPSEAWLYGQELIKLLSGLRFADNPIGKRQKKVLESFLASFRADLIHFAPSGPWLGALNRFYGARG